MNPSRFSISEALNYGWTAFKNKIGFFIGFVIVFFLISFIPSYFAARFFPHPSFLGFIFRIIAWLIGLYLGMAATRIALDIYDRGDADLNRLGELGSDFPSYVGGKFLFGIIVAIGTLLLVIPGIIVSLMFLYVGYLIVDRHMGPIEALKRSQAITNGVKWPLFLFGLIVIILNIIGLACLGIGLLVSIPITMMASAYVYRQLSPAASAAASIVTP